MRVIGGEFRSRILKSVPGDDVRPTPDRLREALFSILQPRIGGAVFADLYAGTGAVGIEALSRGASKAILVEQNHGAVRVIRDNLRQLGIENRAEVRQTRATPMIAKLSADIVFLDPPYHLEKEYVGAMELLGEYPADLVIAQHPAKLELKERYGALQLKRKLKQGDNVLSFYETATPPDAAVATAMDSPDSIP